jgi:hypothetical protein
LHAGPGKNFLVPPDRLFTYEDLSAERIFQEEDVIETKRVMNRPTDKAELKVKGYGPATNSAVLKREIRERMMFAKKNGELRRAGLAGRPKPQCILPVRPVDTQAEVAQMTTYADATVQSNMVSPCKGASLINEVDGEDEAENLVPMEIIDSTGRSKQDEDVTMTHSDTRRPGSDCPPADEVSPGKDSVELALKQ